VVTTDNGVRGFSNVEVSNSKSQFASSDGDGFLFDLRTNSGAVTGGPLVVLNSIAFENAGNGFDVTQDANSGHVVLKGNSAQRHSGTGDDGFVATDTGVGIAVVNCYASENTNDYTIATTNNDFHEEATTTAGNWQFWECFSPGLAASP